jgi:cobalt/nickel transport system ATP-binding protein
VNSDKLIIKLEEIRFAYPEKPLLFDRFDFEFKQGDRIGLIGANGSGKTTLFHLVTGLLRPLAGKVAAFGRVRATEIDFREVREKIGFLFQDADDQLFCPTVGEDIAFGPLNLGRSRDEVKEIVMSTLDILGLKGFENSVTYKFSGGEKKLVSLATVLAMTPEALLLDEPTGGLDEDTTKRVAGILNNLDIPLVIASHDGSFLNETTREICELKEGRIRRSCRRR